MSAERSSQLFLELFSDLPRQGPGSDASTRRAFSLLPPLGAGARVLDLGCGTGAQTFELARLTKAPILAVDLHPPFVAELNAKAAAIGVGDRVRGQVGDMARLDLPERSFDLIWSEGAIYQVGFDRGLSEWGRWLRPGGCIAVTELSWLTTSVPVECAAYWATRYPGLRDVATNLAAIESIGYRIAGQFALPAAAWWDDYYSPLARNLSAFRALRAGDVAAMRVADEVQGEIDMHRRYSEVYGYVFYVLQSSAVG